MIGCTYTLALLAAVGVFRRCMAPMQLVWQSERTTRIPRVLTPHEAVVAFSPDGRLVASQEGPFHPIQVRRVAGGRLVQTLRDPGDLGPFRIEHPDFIAFSPDGSQVAHVGFTSEVGERRLPKGWRAPGEPIDFQWRGSDSGRQRSRRLELCLLFSLSQGRIEGGSSRPANPWVSAALQRDYVPGVSWPAWAARKEPISPNGELSASGGSELVLSRRGRVICRKSMGGYWVSENCMVPWDVSKRRIAVTAVAFSPDGRHLACTDAYGKVRLYRVRGGHAPQQR